MSVRARALTEDEIPVVLGAFEGTYAVRNCGMFLLGILIGVRVSELIALTVGDVYQNGQPVPHVRLINKKGTSRTISVDTDAREVIEELIAWHRSKFGRVHPDSSLFPSQKRGGEMASLNREAVAKIFKTAFNAAGLVGNLTTETKRNLSAHTRVETAGDPLYV